MKLLANLRFVAMAAALITCGLLAQQQTTPDPTTAEKTGPGNPALSWKRVDESRVLVTDRRAEPSQLFPRLLPGDSRPLHLGGTEAYLGSKQLRNAALSKRLDKAGANPQYPELKVPHETNPQITQIR